jgi:hypothetical protein
MITLDFETRSAADLMRWGATRYALDPTTDVLCMAWVYDEEEKVDLWHRSHDWCEESPFPEELCDRIASGEIVEAHNAGFEFVIFNYVLRRLYPRFRPFKLKLEQLRCSAAKGSCLSLPRALGDAAEALNIKERKLADGRRLINKLSKPMARRKGSTEIRFCEEEAEHRANWAYCQQDVRTERAYSNDIPEMSEKELEFWRMDFRMNQRGILLDVEGAEIALDLADKETQRLNSELYELTGVERGSQRTRLLKWMNAKLVELQHMPVKERKAALGKIVKMREQREDRGASANEAATALDKTANLVAKYGFTEEDIKGAIAGKSEPTTKLWVELLPNTKADTLSFSLHGVPTKAGDEAKEAAKPASDAKWESIGPDGAIVRRAMEICMEVNKTSVAKFKRMVDSVTPHDGRLHDIMLFNGADRTGRWSGKGVQPHNFVRGYMENMCDVWDDIKTLDLDYITLIYGEPLVCLAKACRGALIASPGKEIYAADFNAIEARKLAWLSGCTRLLNLFQERGDPYIDMASAIYKRPITKADKTERQLGKKAILGLGYAMGWEKFQATVWADEGIWLPDEMCQEIVRLYRKEMYPEIPKLWKDAGNAAILAVQKGGEHFCGGDEVGIGAVSYFMSDDRRFLHCRLPSGRLLAYYLPKVSVRVTYRFAATNEHGNPTTVNFPAKKSVPQHRVRWHAEKLAEKAHKKLLSDTPESFLSPHLSFMGRDIFTKKWKRVGTHGGTLVENFDQAASRDLLAEAMYRIDQRPEFDLLLSIHDEVIAEAAKDTCTLKEFESLMAEVPDWAPNMPITAEGWIGQRLRK